jgi:uncharacterized protein
MSTSFTPLESSVGGVLIGLSAGALLLHHGRILGVSGMVHGLADRSASNDDTKFRVTFLSGAVAGAFLLSRVNAFATSSAPVVLDDSALWRVAAAGLLVGLGTKVGHGCTSGHGVCGLGRLSPRSLVNVLSFLSAGVATAYFLYPTAPFSVAATSWPASMTEFGIKAAVALAAPVALTNVVMHLGQVRVSQALIGATFGAGLAIGGMTSPAKVLGFLRVFSGAWDPSLMCVLGGAVTVSLLAYQIKNKRRAPLLASRFQVPTKTEIEPRLVVGGVLFGVGWALYGWCPGPAVVDLATWSVVPSVWLACAVVGGIAGHFLGF